MMLFCQDNAVQLRYKKVKLEKFIEKRKRKQDNIKFQRDQKGFFKTLEGDQTRENSSNFGVVFGRKTKNTKYALGGGGKDIAL